MSSDKIKDQLKRIEHLREEGKIFEASNLLDKLEAAHPGNADVASAREALDAGRPQDTVFSAQVEAFFATDEIAPSAATVPIGGAVRVEDSPGDRAAMLKDTPWSEDFDASEIDTLARHMITYHAERAAVFFREGDCSSYMGLIVSGKLSVVKGTPKTGLKYVATLGPGNTFGEMALIENEPRSASVVTNSTSRILILREADFDKLKAEAPNLAIDLIRRIAMMMSARLRVTSGELCEHLNRIGG